MQSDVAALADAFYVKQAETSRVVANRLQQAWRTMDLDGWWSVNGSSVVRTVQGGQAVNATRGAAYVTLIGEMQDATDALAIVQPDGFVIADADADALLRLSVETVDKELAAGKSLVDAKRSGLARLLKLSTTLVADAGRDATAAGVALNPKLAGYYRKLRLPACSRCAVLAGKWFEWNDGFKRHPECDCVHVPAVRAFGSGFDSQRAMASGQVTGLTKQQEADAADGINVTVDTDLPTGFDLGNGPSLATVLDLAGRNRDRAASLLTRYGYAA